MDTLKPIDPIVVGKSTLEYFKKDEVARDSWVKKYAMKDKKGNIYEEIPTDMHWRIANELHRIDLKFQKENPNAKVYPAKFYFDLLDRFKFIIPQGSPMFGIGNNLQTVSLSNCFVLSYDEGHPDSYGTIMKVDESLANLMKRRAGCGTDLSYIRPSDSPVNNSAITSTGVVPFMERYSNTTREVGQSNRRGALMLSINISHPDAEKFIDAKMIENKVTGANVSVKITDDFMEIVKKTTDDDIKRYDNLMSKEDSLTSYDKKELRKLKKKIIYNQSFQYADGSKLNQPIIAKRLWDKIIYNAWSSAEPGVLWWSQIQRESLGQCYEHFGFGNISTNPCVTGDTLVAVADGRGHIPIKQLAEEGVDVSVYSVNPKTGKVDIKWGRNPRLTKEKAEVLKITLNDGSSIVTTPNHNFLLSDGNDIEAKDLTENITLMGFGDINKKHETDSEGDKKYTVVSVEKYGYKDVYNITVDDNHTLACVTKIKRDAKYKYILSGLFIANCGEIPLPSGDSCRLIASNLYSYVNNPFTPESYFDFDLFKEHAHHITRIMDNIVELELEKIDQILSKLESDPEPYDVKRNEIEMWELIKRMCEFGRRTGIGVTAVGDMLASLNLRYGTPEATSFAELVSKTYAIECMRASVDLAEERGAFPIFDWEREKDNPFINRIKEYEPELIDRMSKVGRRNIALMTIAPTGTVSIVTQTSSGIEPAFLISYKRRRKIDPNSKDSKIDFVDSIGDKWQEYRVFHHKFIDWFYYNQKKIYSEINELKDTLIYDNIDYCFEFMTKLWNTESEEFIDRIIAMSPYHKALANDVDWVEKVRMQGAIQKWVDHSISVTVNLPNDVDEKLVNDVYMASYESGCKGCTIYRDGSRSGVLISDKSDKDKLKEELFKENHAPKRPKKLECDVIPFSNKGERWISFVGLLNDKPYELFTGRYNDDINIPNNIDKGYIIKHKLDGVSSYIFHYEDKDGNDVESINLKTIFDDKFNDNARMLSAMLRHGMPINYTISLLHDLNLDGDLINSWKTGVRRILKRYLKNDDQLIPKGKTCSNCGSNKIAMIEGCETCQDCGSSKCN